jgi:hypothetical protein
MVGGRRHWEIRILHRMTVRFSGRQLRGAEKWRRVGKPGFRQVWFACRGCGRKRRAVVSLERPGRGA